MNDPRPPRLAATAAEVEALRVRAMIGLGQSRLRQARFAEARTVLEEAEARGDQEAVDKLTRANWRFTTEAVPELADGDVLVKTLFLSLDPAMRGWMCSAVCVW